MRTKELKNNRMAPVAIAILACAALLYPTGAMAAGTVCNTPAAALCDVAQNPNWTTSDCDGDGLTDYEECTGITLTAGKSSYQGVFGQSTLEKLNPAIPDQFYMLADSGLNDLTADNATYKTKSLLFTNGIPQLYSSQLKVNLHKVMKADILAGSDRFLIWTTSGTKATPKLKATVIKEDMISTAGSLGITKEGNPLGPMTPSVVSTIYTTRIKNNVNTNCGSNKCYVEGTTITNFNSSGIIDNTPIINFYIQQVVSHEFAHASFLSVPKSTVSTSPAFNSTATTSDYHYTDPSLIMVKVAAVSSAKSATTGLTEVKYVIGTKFDPTLDTYGLTLK